MFVRPVIVLDLADEENSVTVEVEPLGCTPYSISQSPELPLMVQLTLTCPSPALAETVGAARCASAGAAANSESAPRSRASIRETNVPRLFIAKSEFLGGGGIKLVPGQFFFYA